MKPQRVNPNMMNPMEMNNMSAMMGMMNNLQRIGTVSYTHLDVYKRQVSICFLV